MIDSVSLGFSLISRGMPGDLTETSEKMMYSSYEIRGTVHPYTRSAIRGHSSRLLSNHTGLKLTNTFFTNGITPPWNRPLQHVSYGNNIQGFQEARVLSRAVMYSELEWYVVVLNSMRL